jgi:mannose-6-phosphate isomerase
MKVKKTMVVDAHRIRRLQNPVMPYAWGSRTAIADLTGRPVPSPQPEAELWMGAHPKAPSQVICNGHTVSLRDWIAQAPEAILGEKVTRRFGSQLPFLFKVLAAAEPLSIQAHPNIAQARTGYERENHAGISLDAPHRNYRDDNHKPEILCALTEFWGLNGFRAMKDIHRQLERYCPDTLAPFFEALDRTKPERVLRHLFEYMMALQGQTKNNAISEAIYQAMTVWPNDPISGWVMKLNTAYPGDIGILAPIILNLVDLAPGQAMYLPAGQLHAYLEGVGIELMANSDNVLRGGLTPKHIDREELMGVLHFEASDPGIMTAQSISSTEACFLTSAEEFSLVKLAINAGCRHEALPNRNIEILIVLNGQATLEVVETGEAFPLRRGDSLLIPAAAAAYRISGRVEIYKATVP